MWWNVGYQEKKEEGKGIFKESIEENFPELNNDIKAR